MKNKVVTSPVNMEERVKLGIKAGDTVRVWLKIQEKDKVRLQAFEGLVLARKHGSEAGGTFTVRKVSSGVGVEKIFPLHSPTIDKIEIVKRAKVRRAKLYFIRDKVAREVKRLLRRTTMMGLATKGSAELAAERKVAEDEESKRQEEETARAAEEAKTAESGSPDQSESDLGKAKKEEEKVEEVSEETTEEEVTEDDKKEIEETPVEEEKKAKADEVSSPDASEEAVREEETETPAEDEEKKES